MTSALDILLMDDDPEVLDQLKDSLPKEFRGYAIRWDPCGSFEDALQRIQTRRYDLVVTDVYRDQKNQKKGTDPGAAKGVINVEAIRGKRFCPVIAFSDGSMPEGFKVGPFTRFADKSPGNQQILEQMGLIFDTGIPQVASKLHNELDGVGCSYMWEFLESNWETLRQNGVQIGTVSERLIRRRAAIQLGRIDPSKSETCEVQHIEGVEFYIFPKLSQVEYRLGEIIRKKGAEEYRVILTPHCHLTIQTGEVAPRADYVLTVRTIPAAQLIADKTAKKKTLEQKKDALRRCIKSSPEVGRPEARYWFLPRFLGMSDSYCDFMRIESLVYQTVATDYEPFAVLDSPFAEALQACFTKFYGAVGLPNLRSEGFTYLVPQS